MKQAVILLSFLALVGCQGVKAQSFDTTGCAKAKRYADSIMHLPFVIRCQKYMSYQDADSLLKLLRNPMFDRSADCALFQARQAEVMMKYYDSIINRHKQQTRQK